MKKSRLMISILLVASACDSEPETLDTVDHDAAHAAESTPGPEAAVSGVIPASLPIISPAADCVNSQPLPPVPACAWVASHDVVVTGVVDDIRAFFDPTARGNEGAVNDCDRVHGGLEFDLLVNRSFWDEAPPEVTVRVTPVQLDDWYPAPAISSSGEVSWPPDVEGRLEDGMEIGLALIEYPSIGVWSPSGSSLFFFPGGVSAFQDVGAAECIEPPPDELAGLPVEKFETHVESCQSADGWQRRAELDARVSEFPQTATHAVCISGG